MRFLPRRSGLLLQIPKIQKDVATTVMVFMSRLGNLTLSQDMYILILRSILLTLVEKQCNRSMHHNYQSNECMESKPPSQP